MAVILRDNLKRLEASKEFDGTETDLRVIEYAIRVAVSQAYNDVVEILKGAKFYDGPESLTLKIQELKDSL